MRLLVKIGGAQLAQPEARQQLAQADPAIGRNVDGVELLATEGRDKDQRYEARARAGDEPPLWM